MSPLDRRGGGGGSKWRERSTKGTTFRGMRNGDYGVNKRDVEITFDGVKGKVRRKEGEETGLSKARKVEMEMLSD